MMGEVITGSMIMIFGILLGAGLVVLSRYLEEK